MTAADYIAHVRDQCSRDPDGKAFIDSRDTVKYARTSLTDEEKTICRALNERLGDSIMGVVRVDDIINL